MKIEIKTLSAESHYPRLIRLKADHQWVALAVSLGDATIIAADAAHSRLGTKAYNPQDNSMWEDCPAGTQITLTQE